MQAGADQPCATGLSTSAWAVQRPVSDAGSAAAASKASSFGESCAFAPASHVLQGLANGSDGAAEHPRRWTARLLTSAIHLPDVHVAAVALLLLLIAYAIWRAPPFLGGVT